MKIKKKYNHKNISPSKNTIQNLDLSVAVFLPHYENFGFKDIDKQIFQETYIKNHMLLEQKRANILYYQDALFSKERLELGKNDSFATNHQKFRRNISQKKRKIKKNQHFFSTFLQNIPSEVDYRDLFKDPFLEGFLGELLSKGFLKKKKELVYRDISTQTFVNGDDIVWKEVKSTQLEIRCFVETRNDTFVLVVDDLFSLFGDVGILVHPKDKRYKKNIGKKIILPLLNRSIPILGDETIDTVKNNGIFRLNPYFSPDSFAQLDKYGLTVETTQYRDASGHFAVNISSLLGKNIFDFKKNLIETLDAIGNCVSRREIMLQKPFSRFSNQELLPQISEVWVLDLEEIKDEINHWITENYSKELSEFSFPDRWIFPIETASSLGFYRYFLQQDHNQSLISREYFHQRKVTIFEALVVLAIITEILPQSFSIEEFLDFFYILGKEGLDQILSPFFSRQEIQNFFDHYVVSGAGEDLFLLYYQSLENIDWIVCKGASNTFEVNTNLLHENFPLTFFSVDVNFLKSLKLFYDASHEENLILPFFLNTSYNQLALYIIFAFLSQKKLPLIYFKNNPQIDFNFSSQKLKQWIQDYGSDAIKLCLLKNTDISVDLLEKEYLYLNHFWNLYKYFFENIPPELISSPLKITQFQISKMDTWILYQWYQILETFSLGEDQDLSPGFLDKLQVFTLEPFSRYLVVLKNQSKLSTEDLGSFHMLLFLFSQITLILYSYAPEISQFVLDQFSPDFLKQLKFYQELPFESPKKDYKVQLFFDIVKSIIHYKQKNSIPKHQPISLMIRANSDVCDLIENYKSILFEISPIKDLHLTSSHDSIPAHYDRIYVFDIEIGIEIAPTISSLSLEDLEKNYKMKEKQIVEIRSLLTSLPVGGVVDSEKISKKEQEMETLKDELDLLDVQIKRLKMLRKR